MPDPPTDASVVLPLYRGAAPGSESWTWHEEISAPPWGGANGRLVRNVVHPELIVFQPPDKTRANRTAVIVAPGGADLSLSIDSEGYDVARALAANGFTAIVLKYRLKHTPDDEARFRKLAMALVSHFSNRGDEPTPPPRPRTSQSLSSASNLDIADGIAAVQYVREHAEQLRVDPNRIGMIGFSNGGSVTTGTILHGGPQSRLEFAGLIYGAFGAANWPAPTPPIFMAVANDDPIASSGELAAFASLRAQHRSVELHVFENGAHGFGMQRRGLTADHWLDEFVAWLAANGYTT